MPGDRSPQATVPLKVTDPRAVLARGQEPQLPTARFVPLLLRAFVIEVAFGLG